MEEERYLSRLQLFSPSESPYFHLASIPLRRARAGGRVRWSAGLPDPGRQAIGQAAPRPWPNSNGGPPLLVPELVEGQQRGAQVFVFLLPISALTMQRCAQFFILIA